MFVVGIIVFALGILISIALHEAGHMWSARAFGMKVTRFFIGFGPTIFAFKRKGVEYGLKAIPAGAFVKIVGMTPQDDDVEPGDEHRAMWRYPVWKRTIVMAAGSLTHFALGLVLLWITFAFVPLPHYERLEHGAVTLSTVADCIEPTVEIDPDTQQLKQCEVGTDHAGLPSLATQLGLLPGDTIVALNGEPVDGWEWLTTRIRAAGGQEITLTVQRGDETFTASGVLPVAERLKVEVANSDRPVSSITDDDLESVGVLGVTPRVPTATEGPLGAFPATWDQTVFMFENVFTSLQTIPAKVPKLWDALTGAPRDPETPVSVVGVSRIGGELFGAGEVAPFLMLLVVLNFFVGLFNLVPLLPLDGGHIAVAWFERVRSWLYARFRRPDPGRVDYNKLMPLTLVVILVLGGFSLLTIAADIFNPIVLYR